MSFRRIWAIFLRYFYLFTKFDQMADVFYWPAVDLLMWGITMLWIERESMGEPHVLVSVITALILWQIVWRGNYEIAVNPLQEFWNRNLVNLFSTPLKLGEWFGGLILLCLVKIGISLTFDVCLVKLLYGINILSIGWAFIPFGISMLITGWVFGLMGASIIIYWGQRLQMMVWMIPYLFAPFSAMVYPASALPAWAEPIAWSLPTTYIFEGMRGVIAGQGFNTDYFLMSMFLNAIYFIIMSIVFKVLFEKSRAKGLARLE
jgi:ABC-2 type transport system permease protein